MSEAEKYLAEHAVIFLDLGLPDAQGLEAYGGPTPPRPGPAGGADGLDDESLAQALQEGAQDYLIKGQIETRGLLRALRYAIERKTMEEALFAKRNAPRSRSTPSATPYLHGFGNITFLNLVAEKMTGWSRQKRGRHAEVFRILTPQPRTTPDPIDGADRNRTCTCRRILSRPADDLKFRSKIRRPIHDREGQAPER